MISVQKCILEESQNLNLVELKRYPYFKSHSKTDKQANKNNNRDSNRTNI